MENEFLPSLSVMPNEIFLKIISCLPTTTQIPLAIVSRRMTTLVEYYKVSCAPKKIRLVADNLRVLLVSPCSDHEFVDIAVEQHRTTKVPRLHLISIALSTNKSAEYHSSLKKFKSSEPYLPWYLGKTIHFDGKKLGDKQPTISLITATGNKMFRKMLWMKAYSADLCVLVVDPDEIDDEISDIKTMAFGSHVMMGLGSVVIAVNMSKHVQNINPRQVFYAAKLKMLKALKAHRMMLQIVPVDVVRGTNIIEKEDAKFSWFEGPSLTTIVHNDQERTNFDEVQYGKLAEQPLLLQAYASGTYNGSKVVEGLVLRGTVKKGDVLCNGDFNGRKIYSMERAGKDVDQVGPGDRIAVMLSGIRSLDLLTNKAAYWMHKTKMSFTHAFRAELAIQSEKHFAMNQTYVVFYGPSRIRCVMYWMWPKNNDNFESPYSIDRKCIVPRRKPKMPTISPKDIISHRPALKRERRAADEAWYEKACSDELEMHLLRCEEAKKNHKRPPKPKLPSKVLNAILIPLDPVPMESYKLSPFEKNPGVIMIIAAHSIVAVGRVDRVINLTNEEAELQMRNRASFDFKYLNAARKQIIESRLHTLFTEKEPKQLELCGRKLTE